MTVPREKPISTCRTPLFGLVAPQLGWVPPLRFLLRRRRILRLLSPISTGRLVEVGCGAGALLVEFDAAGFEVVGVESSPRALMVARRLAMAAGGKQQLLAEPGTDWQHSFDLLCAFDVLEHIENDSAALDEWISWLRPGGKVCLSVPAHQHRWSEGDEWAGHYRRYSRGDLERMLGARGFRILHLECYGFPLANLTEFVGKRTYRKLLEHRSTDETREQASAGSGVDHRSSMKMFRWLDTFPGRLALRACFLSQAMFSRTDLGSGFLVLAEKQ